MSTGFDVYALQRSTPSHSFEVPVGRRYTRGVVFGEKGAIVVGGSDWKGLCHWRKILSSGSINHPRKAHLSHSGDHCKIYLFTSGFYWLFIIDPEFRQSRSDYQRILRRWFVYLHFGRNRCAGSITRYHNPANREEKDKASVIAKEEQRRQSGRNYRCQCHTFVGLIDPCIDMEVMGPSLERRTGFHSFEGKGFARESSLQLRGMATPFP